MAKSLPWIILGGITLIVTVIVVQVLGAILYLYSPDRVVRGAFSSILEAKSFAVKLEVTDDAPAGLSLKADGVLDKQQLSKPVADLKFSFQNSGHSFSGNGIAKATDGEVYLRFDKIVGIPEVLPGALQSVWADLNVDTLLVVGKENLFPQAAGNLTEADLQAVKEIALDHIPFKSASKGESGHIGLETVMHYKVELDRDALTALLMEINTAVKGSALTKEERVGVSKMVGNLPSVTGEIWVAKEDGTMRAAVISVKGKDSTVKINIHLSDFNRPLAVDTPPNAKPLIDLVRKLTGPTLGNSSIRLPFTIPVPIYDIDQKIPEITGPASVDTGEDLGGLPNLIRLFYGTDKLFAPDQE